jgi:hypothetical protein
VYNCLQYYLKEKIADVVFAGDGHCPRDPGLPLVFDDFLAASIRIRQLRMLLSASIEVGTVLSSTVVFDWFLKPAKKTGRLVGRQKHLRYKHNFGNASTRNSYFAPISHDPITKIWNGLHGGVSLVALIQWFLCTIFTLLFVPKSLWLINFKFFNMFSFQDGENQDESLAVPWPSLARAIVDQFKLFTGAKVPLTEVATAYVAEKLFGTAPSLDDPTRKNELVTHERFAKVCSNVKYVLLLLLRLTKVTVRYRIYSNSSTGSQGAN